MKVILEALGLLHSTVMDFEVGPAGEIRYNFVCKQNSIFAYATTKKNPPPPKTKRLVFRDTGEYYQLDNETVHIFRLADVYDVT